MPKSWPLIFLLLTFFVQQAPPAQTNDELVQAIANGNMQSIKDRLARGVDANSCVQNFQTPVMAAVETGNVEIVRLLLEKGANVNGKCMGDMTRVLLENGADVNLKNNDGVTALIAAVRRNDPFSVKLLLARGADVNAVTKDGDTPMKIAARTGDARIAERLRQAGAK